MRSLRVGVDMHVLAGKFQGSRTYLIEVYGRLVRLAPEWTFIFFVVDGPNVAFHGELTAPNVQIVNLPHSGALMRLFWHLPRHAVKNRVDILHTQYIAPIWGVFQRVVTVHDILFETRPELFSPTFVARSKILVRVSAIMAKAITTVSDFSKREIEQKYKILPSKIFLTPNGVDIDAFGYASPLDAGILNSRGLAAQKYVLSVGRIEPRKRFDLAAEALSVPECDDCCLVIVGQLDRRGGEIVQELKNKWGARVLVLTDVTDRELPAIYRGAKAFVYCSEAEGFGIPLIEAMAACIPIIVAPFRGVDAIVGGAAEVMSEWTPAAVRSAVSRVLSSAQECDRAKGAGRARAEIFSWDNAAKGLLEALNSVRR